MKLKLESIINSTRKHKTYILSGFIILSLILIEEFFFRKRDPDIYAFILKEQKTDKRLTEIGSLRSLKSRFKSLKEDSIIFKTYGKFSKKDVVIDGVTFKENNKWLYNHSTYIIVEKNDTVDSLLKHYLDGSEVNWP